ncbi:TPA: hypothetical protein DIU22_05420 [Candidatus Woesebacteria bacterium]|nr:hypothetical protein [Candidatus Woesebacteria bacterium]HLA23013.1 class I SAM-dependent methyltransferase [Candidatus Nanoarchaeia archaeon]
MSENLSTSFLGLKNRVHDYFENPKEIIRGTKTMKSEKLTCQICSSERMHKFLSLGHHPNPDGFLTEEKLKEPEIYFPLDVYFCEDCCLVQLGYAPNPELLFTEDFVYTTGSSKELADNFHSLVENVIKKFNLLRNDFAVDIGGNDGTSLSNYLPYGIKVLNVDPSKAAEMAQKKNVPTMKDFFNEKTAIRILRENGKAKVITATNVFAHVRELDSFMNGIKILLDAKGVFIEESHYIRDLLHETEYDSIYAEHLRYYSLKPLIYLFDKFDMDVFDAEKITTHGGSLRVYACGKGDFPISENVKKILIEEEEFGLYSRKIYDSFGKKVFSNMKEIRSILFKAKEHGNIVGIGAPAKGNTLLNFCKIGKETIDCLLEYGSLKVGMYSPGMHIPIKDESILFQEPQPTYALLLAWNLKSVIVPKLRQKGFRGKIIIPVPEPHVID